MAALFADPFLAHRFSRLLPQLLPWFFGVLVAALIIIPVSILGWLFFATDIFVVQAVTVLDARAHTTAAAKQIVQEHLDRGLLTKNIFFIQSDLLEAALAASLPQVRTVHVARKLPGTIKIIIQEKTAALLLLSNTDYFFVDASGTPYEEARLDTLPGTLLPTVKNDDQSSRVTLGVPVVASSFVQFIQYLQKEVPAVTGAEVAEIRIPSLSAREVHFLLDNNWELRFDVTRDAAAQTDTLRKVLESTISPEERAALEYIDLRIQDRVYYKTRTP